MKATTEDEAEVPTTELGRERAGRGGIYVLGAKAFFIVAGFVQQTLLQRLLGDATYGALSRVFAASNIPNNVMVSSSTQGVSRAIAGAPGNETATLRLTMRVHVLVSLVVALSFAASAPLIANFQHAPHILAPLWVMSGVLAIYGVYAALVGYLNGRALFSKQASLDILAATLRTIALLAFGLMATRMSASAVLGATAGMATAIGCVFALAIAWVLRDALRISRDSKTVVSTAYPEAASVAPLSAGKYLRGLLPVIGAQAFTSALMQADILLLGNFLAPVDAASAKSADEWIAAYRGAQLFAFLPYQLLFSVTQVLFPLLARARASGTPAEVAELVTRGARIGVVVLTMLVSVVAALPSSLLRFAYTDVLASRGTEALRALAPGQACFAIMGLACTVLVSLGYELRALALTGAALVLVTTSAYVFASHAPFGAEATAATARATSLALGITAVAAILVVRKTAGAFAPPKTIVAGVAIVAIFWFGGRYIPALPRGLTLLAAPAIVAASAALLFAAGALKKSDITMLLATLRRKKSRTKTA